MRTDIQFKKGALEMSVLHFLSLEDYYGYDLRQKINPYISITEGALYPVLKRLMAEGHCTSYYKESQEGPQRKYYSLTDSGREYYKELVSNWDDFVERIARMREENRHDEHG